ncbi:MAG TPA: sulfotransferase family protein [Candidatus Tenderia sp.]|nr:sulfotransferase family protein [Candidatus Tenderia sp.]
MAPGIATPERCRLPSVKALMVSWSALLAWISLAMKSSGIAKKERAKALFAQQKYEAAKQLLMQVCRKEQQDVEAWFTLGIVHGAMGEMAEAVPCFEQSIRLMPELAEAHFNLGKAKFELDQVDEAIRSYQQALQLNPNWPQVLNNLGNAYSRLERAHEAMSYYQQAVTLAPNYVGALINFNNTIQLLGRYEEAVAGYKQVLAIEPGHSLALTNLGTTLLKLERYDEAIDCCRYASQLFPDNPGPPAIEAKIHAMKGDWESAYQILDPLIQSHPEHIQVVISFAVISHHVGRQDEAVRLAKNVLAVDRSEPLSLRIDLHFELGKIYDKQKKYAEAFQHFAKGNELKPGDYDADNEVQETRLKTTFFTKEFFQQQPQPVTTSERPLFILGMPRSGTSLVEQILDSHEQVKGGGELYVIDDFARKTTEMAQHPYPESLAKLTQDERERFITGYLAKLNKISVDARYVTDKMPQNYLHLGLIAWLFPGARVIHCYRDPIDTCLSCFFQNFKSTLTFSKDLHAVSHYYRQYRQLMAHWQKTLDLNFLNVSYEALTADQEGITREILEFLELPWDENCLNFHDNKRVVATASMQQVRKPIYRSSVKRWKHYEPYIGVLIDNLGEL